MNKNCILCEDPLTTENRSREHIIPKRLGWRIATNESLCRDCNNVTGSRWDSELEKQLRRYSILVELPNSNTKPRREVIRESSGRAIVLKTGMRGGPEGVQEIEEGGVSFLIAERQEDLEKEARRRQEEGIWTEVQTTEFLERQKERVEVEHQIEFEDVHPMGGPEFDCSVVKCMMNAACKAGYTVDELRTGQNFLKGRTSIALTPRGTVPIATFLPLRQSAVEDKERERRWIHCVHVEADLEQKFVYGYLELYGTFRFSAIIGRAYLGGKKSITLGFDVEASRHTKKGSLVVDLKQAKDWFLRHHCGRMSVREIWEANGFDVQELVAWGLNRQNQSSKILVERDRYTTTKPSRETKIVEQKTRLIFD